MRFILPALAAALLVAGSALAQNAQPQPDKAPDKAKANTKVYSYQQAAPSLTSPGGSAMSIPATPRLQLPADAAPFSSHRWWEELERGRGGGE